MNGPREIPTHGVVRGGGLCHLYRCVAVAALAATSFAAGCGGTPDATSLPTQAAVAVVTISPLSATLHIGETRAFSAALADAGGNTLTGRAVNWTSSDVSVVAIDAAGVATGQRLGTASINATSEGVRGTAAVVVGTTVSTIVLTPAAVTTVVRRTEQFAVVARDSAGHVVTGTTTWSSSDTTVALVSAGGMVTALAAGQATITASVEGKSATAAMVVTPVDLAVRGLFTSFEDRGFPNGYYDGDLLQRWDSVDVHTSTTVAVEVAAQFDAMRALGVNTITFDLRSTDPAWFGGFGTPECKLHTVLGLAWPTPEAFRVQRLVRFFDLAQQKGIRIILFLANTHMEQPTASNAQWLSPVLSAVGQHPALFLVLFTGSTQFDAYADNGCGAPAEAPLWLGPTSVPALYVEWAIGYARSLGISPAKLSTEAVIGHAFINSRPANPVAPDGHLWDPLVVLKGIFDHLQIPDSARTYALSFYEHQKCISPAPAGCVEIGPAAWAEQTIRDTWLTIGRTSKAAVVASEIGTDPDPAWSAVQGLESQLTLMEKYGWAGGSYYRWTSFTAAEDADPNTWMPVKRRGYAYTYTPLKDVLVRHYLR
ncbi:MAG TPA: Ig-like domain-containing protein [Gemmatimonadaceae bacterium]